MNLSIASLESFWLRQNCLKKKKCVWFLNDVVGCCCCGVVGVRADAVVTDRTLVLLHSNKGTPSIGANKMRLRSYFVSLLMYGKVNECKIYQGAWHQIINSFKIRIYTCLNLTNTGKVACFMANFCEDQY